MAFITEWVANIILLVLFAAILELLLPNSSLQRYVKLVVGLMVLMVMIQPVLSIFHSDPEEWFQSMAEWVDEGYGGQETSINQKKMDIEDGTRAYISEYMAVLLKRQVSDDLNNRFGVVPASIEVEMDHYTEGEEVLEGVGAVRITLTERLEEVEGDSEVTDNLIVPVETVAILPADEITGPDEGQGDAETSDSGWLGEIRNYLAGAWSIPEELIEVEMKGGGSRD
ncbi:stage III sporulation protein AF [Alteribacter natronophilus]|uniref:stage III sporulation protein AF n=1 Tax=Alteribacter natronophilus TaxID=2583810 RepID=UPI00110DB9BA|nr:stage III sporulation protein AF [Alteribacter natronophilus]TMW73753.1 stage III sporulation protein AF [Alteribacter natronophilus]